MEWSVERQLAPLGVHRPSEPRRSARARPKARWPRHGHRPRKNALSFHSGLSLSLYAAGEKEGGENICRGRKKRRRLQLPLPLVVSLNLLKVPIPYGLHQLCIRIELRKR